MKTIEEKANDFVTERFPNDGENDYHQSLCYMSYIQGFKEAFKWIFLNDDLPIIRNINYDILVKTINNDIFTITIYSNCRHTIKSIFQDNGITHWRYLEDNDI